MRPDMPLAPAPAAVATPSCDGKVSEVWSHPADLYAVDEFWP